MNTQAPSVLVAQVGTPTPAAPAAPAVQTMSQVAKATTPVDPPKEAARLKKAYVPRSWEHHKEDAEGRPIAPKSTIVYFEKGDPTSAKVCHTEEEYIDALNRGARDTFAPEAWT